MARILFVLTEPTEKWLGWRSAPLPLDGKGWIAHWGLKRSCRPNWRSWGTSGSCSRLKEDWQTDWVARNVSFRSMDGWWLGSDIQEELGPEPRFLHRERRQLRCFRVFFPFLLCAEIIKRSKILSSLSRVVVQMWIHLVSIQKQNVFWQIPPQKMHTACVLLRRGVIKIICISSCAHCRVHRYFPARGRSVFGNRFVSINAVRNGPSSQQD